MTLFDASTSLLDSYLLCVVTSTVHKCGTLNLVYDDLSICKCVLIQRDYATSMQL